MPVFGNQTAGVIVYPIEDKITGGIFTMGPTNGIAVSITIDLFIAGTTDSTMKCGIYNASQNYIAETEERVITVGTDNWETFNFASSPLLLANAQYFLVAWAPTNATSSAYISSSTPDIQNVWIDAATYNSWPSPASLVNDGESRNSSIYCTYNEASGRLPMGLKLNERITNMKMYKKRMH